MEVGDIVGYRSDHNKVVETNALFEVLKIDNGVVTITPIYVLRTTILETRIVPLTKLYTVKAYVKCSNY